MSENNYTPFNSQDSQIRELENSINEKQECEEEEEFDIFYETLLVCIDVNCKYYLKNMRDIFERAESRLKKFFERFNPSEIHDTEFEASTVISQCCVCMRTTTCGCRIITKSKGQYDVFVAGSGCAAVVNYYIWITRDFPNIAKDNIGTEREQYVKLLHKKSLETALHQLRISLAH